MSNNLARASGSKQATTGATGATAKKLVQAAALAAVLVPLGSVAVETATINCVTSQNEGSCFGSSGSYAPDGSGSNTWKFFTDGSFTTLIYTLEITGTPTSAFSLDVSDVVTTQDDLVSSEVLGNFPGAECIPTFDTTQCGLFDVFTSFGQATWEDNLYDIIIRWMSSASQPPDDGRNHILRAPDNGVFEDQLAFLFYDPDTDPIDPALGGRGDDFSRFGAFRTVPEPATLLLLGTGIAAAMYRRRRRHP